MKKIPTIFVRDWDGDRSRVLNEINPECQWVINGEGWPTCKIDGTSCLYRDGNLYKRRELKPGQQVPAGFELADHDEETGKRVGWLQIGDGPEDKYHVAAMLGNSAPDENGTYELIGPLVQGNKYKLTEYTLISHEKSVLLLPDMPRTFDGIREFLEKNEMEGIVFHHLDGRMAKIKRRDFGLSW